MSDFKIVTPLLFYTYVDCFIRLHYEVIALIHDVINFNVGFPVILVALPM